MLTFQISRTKAKANQTESQNHHNKQTNKIERKAIGNDVSNIFGGATKQTKIKENEARHTQPHMIGRSFNASAICWNVLRSRHN